MTDLVHTAAQDADDVGTLRARVAELQAALADRAAENGRLTADLAAFRIRYRQDVGLLHEELDELERAIAEAELGELSKRVEETASEAAESPVADQASALPRFTSDAVRRLFRDVAKTVHPDLARDEETRARRHRLMAEANRAYALGDEERLRSILDAWEKSADAVQGSDAAAVRLRLVRRIADIEEQLNVHAGELAAMRQTALWQLKAMVDEASAQGRDLVADMVRRLKRDVTAARNRLDAMRWNP